MWISVSLYAPYGKAETLSETLMEQGALSVSIEDADAGTPLETPQFGEPGQMPQGLWERSKVIALFSENHDIEGCICACTQQLGLEQTPDYTCTEVPEENWVALTQAQFDPIEVTPDFWIVPSWHQPPPPPARFLVLDPGMAFGTGSHPTTRLCLRWLAAQVQPTDSVLDYGCGSGILAIAAARLGAKDVMAVDIDPHALEAAEHNAHQNAVKIGLRHSGLPLHTRYDVVVANILTNPLCVMAPLLAARLAPAGRIALSGVLDSQARNVIDAYTPYMTLEVRAEEGGWILLEGTLT
jgi:ribosomal protein L11 methyltransferase